MAWSAIKRNATDALFSDIVRMRAKWVCERCRKDCSNEKHKFDCSHFITRGNKRLRWDFENALALCRGCHQYFGKNSDDHVEFMRRKLGEERYDLLRARKFRKWSDRKVDEKLIRFGLKKLLERMKAVGLAEEKSITRAEKSLGGELKNKQKTS